jgi:hypothetical protein
MEFGLKPCGLWIVNPPNALIDLAADAKPPSGKR